MKRKPSPTHPSVNSVDRRLHEACKAMKELTVKDSDLTRKIRVFFRRTLLRDNTVFVCGIVVLFLAAFAQFALYIRGRSDIWFFPFFYAFFFAPVFGVLAARDILKRRWTWKRGLAFLCSALAMVLVAIQLYVQIFQGDNNPASN